MQGKLGAYVARVLASAALQVDISVHLMHPTEAELLRHMSILWQAAGRDYFDALERAARRQSLQARMNDDALGLQALLEQSDSLASSGDPEGCTPRAPRISALADHIRARGARKVGFYLGAGRPATDAPLAQLRAALDAVGLETASHVVGAGDLSKFKDECDIVVATRMTADLHDIVPKLLTRDQFAA